MRSRPPPPPPEPNSHLGPYIVLDRLAVGGMAEVFRAQEPRNVGEPRSVVIKRMLPELASDPKARAMFAEEARLGSMISHPNVVEVLDHGVHEDQPYLVLEMVPGCDLWRFDRWLRREGRQLPPGFAMYIVQELLAGLHAVHQAGGTTGSIEIVHRDVSPSNVLLSIHGEVKLSDFGIARALAEFTQPATERGKGKIGYLAPEQVVGSPSDQRADVFAAGVVAAELLMGRALFSGGSELAVLLAIRDAKIHPFLELNTQLPEGLVEVVATALAKLPENRFPSAEAFHRALSPFVKSSTEQQGYRDQLAEMVSQSRSDYEDFPERTPLLSEPSTAEVPTLSYEVKTQQGKALPRLSYAQLIEAIATGKLGLDDLIRQGNEVFRPIASFAGLLRHMPMSTQTPLTRDAPVAVEPDQRRTFAGGGFTLGIAQCIVRKETGMWLCERQGVRKEVYIANGVPQFVSSNQQSELLGAYLVSEGVIAQSELDMALAVLPRFDGRLGDTLVALGLIDAVSLFQHIAGQVESKLLDLFCWEEGSADFYRGVAAPKSGFPLAIDPWAILDEGVRRRVEAGLETERFEKRAHSLLRRSKSMPMAMTENTLPLDWQVLLELTKTPIPILDVVERFARPDDPRRGYRLMVILLQLQALSWLD